MERWTGSQLHAVTAGLVPVESLVCLPWRRDVTRVLVTYLNGEKGDVSVNIGNKQECYVLDCNETVFVSATLGSSNDLMNAIVQAWGTVKWFPYQRHCVNLTTTCCIMYSASNVEEMCNMWIVVKVHVPQTVSKSSSEIPYWTHWVWWQYMQAWPGALNLLQNSVRLCEAKEYTGNPK